MKDLTGRTRVKPYQYRPTRPQRTGRSATDGDAPATRQRRPRAEGIPAPFHGRPYPPSLLNTHIGGLRDDPFNAFPIESKGAVPGAFDYFAAIYAPSVVRPPGIDDEARRSLLLTTYYQSILSDAMLFEQIVAWSVAMQLIQRDESPMGSPVVVFHSTNVMRRLRERLVSEEGISDNIVMTVISLAFVTHMTGNLTGFGVHVQALRRLINIRGGVDALGWDGYLKAKVQVIEGAWTALNITQPPNFPDLTAPDPDASNYLKYATHSYPTIILVKINALPTGFQNVALTRRLSIQFINALHLVIVNISRDRLAFRSDSFMAHGILGVPALTTIERLLGTALLAYTMLLGAVLSEETNPAAEMHFELQMKLLMSTSRLRVCCPELLAWLGLVLGEMERRFSWVGRWAARLVGEGGSEDSAWGRKELERSFLPIPGGNSIHWERVRLTYQDPDRNIAHRSGRY